jgi:hypothetical protein
MDAPAMTLSFFSSFALLAPFVAPALFIVVGLAAGLLHFGLLRRNAELFMRGGAVSRALGLLVIRFTLTAAALIFAVRFGAWSLMTCALGILAARQMALRRAGSVQP